MPKGDSKGFEVHEMVEMVGMVKMVEMVEMVEMFEMVEMPGSQECRRRKGGNGESAG